MIFSDISNSGSLASLESGPGKRARLGRVQRDRQLTSGLSSTDEDTYGDSFNCFLELLDLR